jgi:hypothetical protein
LHLKVREAEAAIAARLCELAPTDLDEQVAIQEAFRHLRILVAEAKELEQPGSETGKTIREPAGE